jgi:hypothetical protein
MVVLTCKVGIKSIWEDALHGQIYLIFIWCLHAFVDVLSGQQI